MRAENVGARRSSPRRPVPLLGAILLGLFVLLTGGRPVDAHATVVSIDPANGETLADAPSTVVVEFDEPVALSGDDSIVLDDAGDRVSVSVEAVDRTVRYELADDLGNGTYVVVWGAISLDSHRIAGSSTFNVGAASASGVEVPSGPSASGSALARAMTTAVLLAAAVAGVGVAWFRYRWASAAALPTLAARCCVTGLVAVVVLVPVRTAELRGRWGAMFDFEAMRDVLDGPIGLGTGLLALGLLATLLSVWADRWIVAWWAVGAALVVAGLVADGHTRSATPRWLVIGSDAVHVTAAALWVGGVVALAAVWRRFNDDGERRRAALDVSAHAIWAVVGVTVAGVAMAWTIAPEVDVFWSTRWGIAVVVKVVLVAGLVGLGWSNRRRLRPPADDGTGNELPAAGTLWRSLRIEVVLFAGVFVATAVVVGASPTTSSASPDPAPASAGPAMPVHEVVELGAGAGSVRFDLEPGQIGTNELALTLTNSAGDVMIPASEPTAELSSPDHGVEGLELPLHALGIGVYHSIVDIPLSGRWILTVDVRTGTFDTSKAELAFDVG